MANLIKLISNIGWFLSNLNRLVYYSVPFFTTVQDYMKLKPVSIWVYDRLHKKRRKVTLQIPTQDRNRRKTDTSTFVNFIHQKDAFIAMNVVIDLAVKWQASIYTVHDNFITTAMYAQNLPLIYSEVFRGLHSPLELINKLIHVNLLKPTERLSNYMDVKDRESIMSFSQSDWLSRIKPISYHSVGNPIPKDHLKFILEELIPKKINKTEKNTWDKRISETVNAYEAYTQAVCGPFNSPSDGGNAHADRWDEFKLKLGKAGDKELNYSLHH